MEKENGVLKNVTESDVDLLKSNPDEFWEGVTEIGKDAFRGLYTLDHIDIPEGVTKIGENAFSDCQLLFSASLSSSVREIGEGAFSFTGLTSIDLANGLEKIGRNAFRVCFMDKVVIPSSVNEIGDEAFAFNSLKKIEVAPGNKVFKTTLDKRCLLKSGKLIAFAPSGLSSYQLPQGITELGDYVFHSMDIKEITLPKSLEKIGKKAFYNCLRLKSIAIPENVTEISNGAFTGTKLEKISVEAGNNVYRMSEDESCLIDSNNKLLLYVGRDKKRYSVAEDITEIADGAFYNSNLEKIILPEGLQVIGDEAFQNAGWITSISIPNTVIKIGKNVFDDCSNLKYIYIPEDLEIDENFKHCQESLRVIRREKPKLENKKEETAEVKATPSTEEEAVGVVIDTEEPEYVKPVSRFRKLIDRLGKFFKKFNKNKTKPNDENHEFKE